MSETHNEYYEKVVSNLNSGKDSMFEPAEVVSFDRDTFTITAFGLRSQQTKENVILTFPSFRLDTGIINIPVNGTTGMIFVGPDNENFFLPIQYHLPTNETEVGKDIKKNASPVRLEKYATVNELEQGETMIKNLSGTQLWFKNSGEVEISTSKMHRLSLDAITGQLELTAESSKANIGYSKFYNGTVKNSATEKLEHFIGLEMHDTVPDWRQSEPVSKYLLNKVMKNGGFENSAIANIIHKDLLDMQLINVYEDKALKGDKKVSRVDEEELLLHANLNYKPNTEEEIDNIYSLSLSKLMAKEEVWRNKEDTVTRKKVESVALDSDHLESEGGFYTYEKTPGEIKEGFGTVTKEIIKIEDPQPGDPEEIVTERVDETEYVKTANGINITRGGMTLEFKVKDEGFEVLLGKTTINIKEDVTRIKVGQSNMRIEDDDITFKTEKGSITINDIINSLGG